MAVLFISEERVKEDSQLSNNIDSKYIRPIILDIQDRIIQPVIGTGLYNVLQAEIIAGNVSVNNQILLNDYIQKVIKYYTIAEAVLELNYKFANKNVTRQTGEGSDVISLDEIFRLKAHYENKAEWYAERLVLFLKENCNMYLDYESPGSGCDVIRPAKTAYRTGMALDWGQKDC